MTLITIEDIARTCHEANRAYCGVDDTQRPWADTPENIRRSATDGVRFRLDNPDSPPSASHENWLKFKRADGWGYGPAKDMDKKTHPCFVPYDQLPAAQQIKDHIFVAIVDSLKGHLNAAEA